jgi:hypothetical protein
MLGRNVLPRVWNWVEKASGQNVFHKLALGPFRMTPKKKGVFGKVPLWGRMRRNRSSLTACGSPFWALPA